MLSPLSAAQWDRAKAAHLLNRAAFGGPPEQIDALTQGGMDAAIAKLIDGPATPPPAPAPDWAKPRDLVALREQYRQEMAAAMPVPAPTDEKGKAEARLKFGKIARKLQQDHLIDLGGWWLDRMRDAQDPFEEKMTLFWHGHFATSAQKVKDGYFMWRQNQTFREHARGNFETLVKAMSRDPAMIQWLDLRESRPEHANENFARELMELFTLGEGHYTEKDVTESARAFTGYRIDPRDQSFRFIPREHDFGPKQFLGQSGPFHGDQIIEMIVAQPVCAQFIARKLWSFFAYENPSPQLVETLAQTMRASKNEMRPVLRQLFTSQEFYSAQAMGTQVKSPVQFMVETARVLEADLPPPRIMLGALKQMGQIPFAPPSVKGWDGGKAWISTSTLLFRYNLAGALVAGVVPRRPFANQPAVVDMSDPNAMPPTMNAKGNPAPAPAAPPALLRKVDLARIAPAPLRADPSALVHALAARLFPGPIPAKDEHTFVEYLKATSPTVTDKSVQGLLHLMMSTPRFQLC